MENAEFTAFGRRVLRAAGRRVAAGDVDALPALAALVGRAGRRDRRRRGRAAAGRLQLGRDRRPARGHPAGRPPALGHGPDRSTDAARRPGWLVGGSGGRLMSGTARRPRPRRRGRAVGAAHPRPGADQAPGGRRRGRGRVRRGLARRQGGVEDRPVAGPALAHHRSPRPSSLAWWHWLGLTSLADHRRRARGRVAGVVVARAGCRSSAWAGRRARSWWQRWIVYAPRMPRWLRACGLTVARPRPAGHGAGHPVPPLRGAAPGPAAPGPGAPGGRGAVGAVVGRGPRPAGARADPGGVRHRPPAPSPSPAAWPAARSASSARGWCRSTTSAATGSRDVVACRDLADPGRRRRGATSTCAGCGPGAPSTAPTGSSPSPAGTP